MAQAPQPWDNDPIVSPGARSASASPLREIVGPQPNQPTPQNPDQRISTITGTERTQQQIDQGDSAGHNFADENALRSQFHAERPVADYESVLPSYASARSAADNPAGDLNIINAFAKIMDPSTGVREGEAATVAASASAYEQLLGSARSQLTGTGRLTPEIRRQLLGELETRVGNINRLYSQTRQHYRDDIARRYGFDPDAITGPHAAQIYHQQQAEREAQRPVTLQQTGPEAAPRMGRDEHVEFGGDPHRPDAPGEMSLAQRQQIETTIHDAIVAGRFSRPEDLMAFTHRAGAVITREEATRALNAYRNHRDIGVLMHPYIAPRETSSARGQGGAVETIDAATRGAADTVTAGLASPIAAVGDSLYNGDPFGENLYREMNTDDYDFDHHFYARLAGQIGGGALLPTGAVTAGRSAATAALRQGLSRIEAVAAARAAVGSRLAAEGVAYGGVHGTATGHGDMADRIANGVVEAMMGGAGGGLVGRYAPGSGARGTPRVSDDLPPLVDPATGRLNAPLESASPARRVGAAAEMGIDLPLGAATDRGGAIIEKGLDISPASAGRMNDARRNASDQATAALEARAAQYGEARTMDEGGSAAQVGARQWIRRATVAARDGQPSVVSRAYNAIPIPPNADASLDNTRAALARMTDVFRSNPEFRSIFQNGRLRHYLEALTVPHDPTDELGVVDPMAGVLRTTGRSTERQVGRLSWEDQKHFRSIIGEEIGAERFSDSPSRGQLRSLYAGLSEDMRATATAQGPRALRAFERANTLNRNVENRIEGALVRILGDDSKNNPERALAALQTISQSGRGSSNLSQLSDIRASLQKGGDWDNVASALIRLGGQPARAEGRDFNPQTFVNWYAGMTEPARNLLFGGANRDLRRALDDFVSVSQRLAGTDALRNTSQTASSRAGLGTVAGASALTAGLLTHPILTSLAAAGAAMIGGANYAMARTWTNPKFVRWATGYTRMVNGAARGGTRPSAEVLARQRQYLLRIARASPDIAADITDLDERLFGGTPSQ